MIGCVGKQGWATMTNLGRTAGQARPDSAQPKRLHFLTFLGTGDYHECTYYLADKITSEDTLDPRFQAASCYVQESLVRLLVGAGGEPGLLGHGTLADTHLSKVTVFLTKEAREQRWDAYTDPKPEAGSAPAGLHERLHTLQSAHGFQLTARCIRTGQSEEDQWHLFNRILKAITDEDDVVVFDVTHGFRLMPMVALLALDFVRKVRRITVPHIWYGNPHSPTAHGSPIIDLSPMARILDWSSALQNLLATGHAGALGELMTADDMPPVVATYGTKLTEVAEAVNRASAFKFPHLAQELLKLEDHLPKNSDGQLAPVEQVLELIGDRYRDLATIVADGDIATTGTAEQVRAYLQSQVAAAKMLLAHKQYMQCFTILIEALTTLSHFYTAPSGLPRVSTPQTDGADRRRQGLRRYGLDPARATTARHINDNLTTVRNALNHAYVSSEHQDFDGDTTLQEHGAGLIASFAELLREPLPPPRVYRKGDKR